MAIRSENILKSYSLGGGVQATLSDHTIHYYGGYFQVRLQLTADIPVSLNAFANISEFYNAVDRLGTAVRFNWVLERMAVLECEIDAIQKQLLSSFETNVLPYLSRDEFANRFILSKYRKSLKTNVIFSGN